MDQPPSYFRREGAHRFVPTERVGGAWTVSEQHISPLNGLVAHCLLTDLRERGRDALSVVRISYDILGPVGLVPMDVSVQVLRGGRTIELLEAVVSVEGRAVLRARAWALSSFDTAAAAGGDRVPALAPPDTLPPFDLAAVWPGGYIESIEFRPEAHARPGAVRAWLRTPVPLLPDEPIADLARFVGLLDTANGIAVRESPQRYLFPNVDLTVHLFRQPAGEWAGFDTRVMFGPTGQGLTSSVLFDVDGPVGQLEQILTVRPRPAS